MIEKIINKEFLYDWHGVNIKLFESITSSVDNLPRFKKFLSLITITADYKNVIYVIFFSFIINFVITLREKAFCNKDNFINYFISPFLKEYFIIFLVFFSSMTVSFLMKFYYNYQRPFCINSIRSYLIENLQLSTEYISNNCRNSLDGSFPSVHSIISILLVSYLWQFIDRLYLKFLAILYIIMIGLSRIVLYMHFPSDVIYGYIIGIFYYIIFIYISNLLIKIYYKKFVNKLYDIF